MWRSISAKEPLEGEAMHSRVAPRSDNDKARGVLLRAEPEVLEFMRLRRRGGYEAVGGSLAALR